MQNEPKLEPPGTLTFPAPRLTREDAFHNIEELARKATTDAKGRLRMVQGLKILGDLLVDLPDLTVEEALADFDGLAKIATCNRDVMLALHESINIATRCAKEQKEPGVAARPQGPAKQRAVRKKKSNRRNGK